MTTVVGNKYRIKETFEHDGITFREGLMVECIPFNHPEQEARLDRIKFPTIQAFGDDISTWFIPKGHLKPVSNIKERIKELLNDNIRKY